MNEPELVLAPEVKLIAWTDFHPPSPKIVLWQPGMAIGGQALIEFAGRSCYRSWSNPSGRNNAAYIANLIEMAHFSVLEHASATFWITGISRSCSHELVRHRHLSFCLTGDTIIYQDTQGRGKGSNKKTLAELHEMWQDRRRTYVKTMQVRTVNDAGVIDYGKIKAVIKSGRRPVFRVRCANGMTLSSTAMHRFLTPTGWKRLDDLRCGDQIMANGRPCYQDADWLRTQIERGSSTEQIAAMAAAAPVTVRKWRRKHHLAEPAGKGMTGRAAWNRGIHRRLNPNPLSDRARALVAEAKLGPKNPSWKGGPHLWTNGNAAANKLYASERQTCSVCGSARHVQIHHRDENPHNNDRANIEMLCAACHRWRHTGSPPKFMYPTLIESIEPAGVQETYDIEMQAPHEHFVANGLIVHNSQESQRYVSAEELRFVVPPALIGNTEGVRDFLIQCESTMNGYHELLDRLKDQYEGIEDATERRKVVREAARSLLPNAAETRMVVTGNLRAWRHVLHMRGAAGAEREIRRLAVALCEHLKEAFPAVFADVRLGPFPDGTLGVQVEHSE
jgi:thymidylate synthase ThyX